jgi:hypothetical protein
MDCANRYEVPGRIVRLKDLPKPGRTTLHSHAILAADTAALHLHANPDRPNDFMISDRDNACFVLRLFVSRRRHNERARST